MHHESFLLGFGVECDVSGIAVFVVELFERSCCDPACLCDGFGDDGAPDAELVVFVGRADVVGGEPYLKPSAFDQTTVGISYSGQ